MAKTYRATQHWNHWLSQSFGSAVRSVEQKYLYELLANYFGKHGLLIGVPQQAELIKTSVTACHSLLSPLFDRNASLNTIEGDFFELPILSGSVDLVLLPHSLECTENPRQLLAESCRIVKPEGHIVIVGFNPMSWWGVRKFFTKKNHMPWSMNFLQMTKVKKWLNLADFELIKQETILFSPPIHSKKLLHKFKLFEWLGRKIFKPFGGVYILVAKAKVVPLTPIRMSWQQRLANVQTTMPRPTMRDF